MTRRLLVTPFPGPPRDIPDDAIAVTPHGPAARAIGRPNITLQTLAAAELAKRGRHRADPRRSRKLLREAISDIERHSDAAATARRMMPVLRTILRVGINIEDLRLHGSREARKLANIAGAYLGKLRAEHLVDKEELVWQAANLADLERKVLHIYGYPRARAEEVAFIDRLAADGSVYYLPLVEGADPFMGNAAFAEQMSRSGWTIEDDRSRGPETIGENAAARFIGQSTDLPESISAASQHDAATEVRFALSAVKKLLREGTPANEIAVVARDLDLYAKEVAIVGAEFGIPTMTKLRIPLSETLVGGLVSLLVSVIDRDFEFDDACRLLGHPLGPGMSEETWRTARRRRTEGYDRWVELEDSLGCLEELRSEAERNVSEWVRCIRSIFDRFDMRSRAAFSARETLAYMSLLDELDVLAADGGPTTFQGFAAEVRDILADVNTPFDPSRGGVLITEPDTVVGGRFRHLFVLGMAEGILPAIPTDSPVVDFHERRLLASKGISFEEAADIPRWEALSFFSLLSTATETVTLTYPKTAGKEERIASSFFARLGMQPQPVDRTELCSDEEALRSRLRSGISPPDPSFEAALRRYSVEKRRESEEVHDEFDGVIGESVDLNGHVWSVSQFRSLAGCGFKWFAGHALKLGAVEEMETEASAATLGNLFHFALHYAVSLLGARTREEIVEKLEESVEAGYNDEDLGMPRLPNWEMQRAEFVKILADAVNGTDFIADGDEIVATEQKFRVDLHELKVAGRIDRIDRTREGILAVDYKSGKSKPALVRDREDRKLDLQIAVYTAALKELYRDETIAGGRYYSIKARKGFPGDAADDDLVKAFLAGAVNGPRTGSLPVRPLNGATCEYCEFDPLCRNSARILRKEASAR